LQIITRNRKIACNRKIAYNRKIACNLIKTQSQYFSYFILYDGQLVDA